MKQILFICALLFTSPSIGLAAPKAEAWSRWNAHNPDSETSIDHDRWDRFLSAFVSPTADGINRVAYGAVTHDHAGNLKTYIDEMGDIAISAFNRAEQRAYWINLYNALTVQVVLDAYPVSSIRKINISPGLFSTGPWGRKLIDIEGEAVSLDDIEHRILRHLWKDPRIHYALNCASVGCPNLQVRAFSGGQGDAQLDQAARDYVNHRRAAHVEDGRLTVSSIYIWFQSDFGGSDMAVIEHLRRLAKPALRATLKDIDSLDDDDYDWSLNNQ